MRVENTPYHSQSGQSSLGQSSFGASASLDQREAEAPRDHRGHSIYQAQGPQLPDPGHTGHMQQSPQ